MSDPSLQPSNSHSTAYEQFYGVFNRHVGVFVNQDMIDMATPELHRTFLRMRLEYGLSEAELTILGAGALRDVQRDKVTADNLRPEDFL